MAGTSENKTVEVGDRMYFRDNTGRLYTAIVSVCCLTKLTNSAFINLEKLAEVLNPAEVHRVG